MKKQQYNTSIPWLEKNLELENVAWEQYRSCQAYFYFDADNNLWIKSYDTVVAVISSTGVLSIRAYFSKTTSAQINKIYRSYKDGKIYR